MKFLKRIYKKIKKVLSIKFKNENGKIKINFIITYKKVNNIKPKIDGV